MSTCELTLRPRQQHGKRLVHEQFRLGKKRVLYVAPTGSGKRFQAVDWAMAADRQQRECLIVTDRRTLVTQMADELEAFGVPFGIIMGDTTENRQPFVQVASIQTLDMRYLDEGKEGLPPASLILIDEAHKSPDQYARLLARYPDALWIGLTATPVGPQGRSMIGQIYEVLVEGCRNSELIADGLLLPTTIYAPSEPSIKGISLNDGAEFNQAKLSRMVRGVTSFANVFREWMPFADRKTIVFAPGVAYARGLADGDSQDCDSFRARGIRAAVIEAATKDADRQRMFDEFKYGDLKVLVSVDVLKEGFDAPIASCGIDLQPNSQLRTYWQKVGRIKRAYEGQDEAIWIDMAGNCWRFPHPDEDPEWGKVTDRVSTQDLIQRARDAGKAAPQIRCPQCSAMRQSGPKCPQCGHVCSSKESVRMIRMGEGKLKKLSAEHKRTVELTDIERKAKKWQSELFASLRGGKTLKAAAASYYRRHGEWPPHNIPCMPKRDSVEWSMRVADLYPPKEIMRQFKRESSE